MPHNGSAHQAKVRIPRHETFQPSRMDERTCPETGHVVPLPIGQPLVGSYTLFDDDGSTIHKGKLVDFADDLRDFGKIVTDAGTADSTTDSEDE